MNSLKIYKLVNKKQTQNKKQKCKKYKNLIIILSKLI